MGVVFVHDQQVHDEANASGRKHGERRTAWCGMQRAMFHAFGHFIPKKSLVVIYLRINCLKVRSSLGVLQVDRNGTHVEHAVFDASTPRPDERFI